jgi:hypothetical protein
MKILSNIILALAVISLVPLLVLFLPGLLLFNLSETLKNDKDESNWQGYIDSYFEMCRKTDPIEDPSEYENNEDEA